MLGGTARTIVPEIMYREYKSLYLELRRGDSPGRGGGGGHGAARSASGPYQFGRDGTRPSRRGDGVPHLTVNSSV